MPLRFLRFCLRCLLETAGFLMILFCTAIFAVLIVKVFRDPAVLSQMPVERFRSFKILLVLACPAAGGAAIWAGRKLRYFAFPKAIPQTAADACYVVHGSGAPPWIDLIAVLFVSLGVGGLMDLTADYNPSAVIPRLFVGFGAVWLLPRVWLSLSNDASRNLRWTLRRFYPDKPLLWDSGACLCIGGQQIPWQSITVIEGRSTRFACYITVTTHNPWARVEENVSQTVEALQLVLAELCRRRLEKGGPTPRPSSKASLRPDSEEMRVPGRPPGLAGPLR